MRDLFSRWKAGLLHGNARIAMQVTLMMSSMWCVYAFLAMSLTPLMAPGLQTFCMYVSSTVIQLVALPLIMVGQNLLSQDAEARAKADHAMLLDQIATTHELIAGNADELSLLREIVAGQDLILQRLSTR